MEDPEPGSWRVLWIPLLIACVLGLALRLLTWPEVFSANPFAGGSIASGEITLDGTDGYYHLRRAFLVIQDWPHVPQVDLLMSVPEGATIQWPPLFDLLLATLALLMPGSPERALELVGAFLPVLLGIVEILLVAGVAYRLAGLRSSVVAAGFAALLPGVARFSLLGALDHDPLIEIGALFAILGIIGDRGSGVGAISWRAIAAVALGLSILVHTWSGSIMHLALVGLLSLTCALVTARPLERARLGATLSAGAFIAALVALPSVATSPWSRSQFAAFEGLSWLHEAGLIGLVLLGCVLSLSTVRRDHAQVLRGIGGLRWSVTMGLLSLLGLLALLPSSFRTLLEGLAFLGRSEPFLAAVAESRPLLTVTGELDLRPLLVRLSAAPLLLPLLIPTMVRTNRLSSLVVLVWCLYTTAMALIQARYTHAAALALCVAAGLAADSMRSLGTRRLTPILLGVIAVTPCLAAYVELPGFLSQRFLGRSYALHESGLRGAFEYLRRQPPSSAFGDPESAPEHAVLASWSAGHFIHWIARQATVVNPFGPQGQPAFYEGMRIFFTESQAEFREQLTKHRVRWLVLRADLDSWPANAELAGIDPERFIGFDPQRGLSFLRIEELARLLTFQLAFSPGSSSAASPATGSESSTDRLVPGLREVSRSRQTIQGPFGPVPSWRIYEWQEMQPIDRLGR